MAEIHTNEIDSNIGWVGIGFSNAGNISDGSGDFCEFSKICMCE